ncbi:hypothetical protein [Pelagibius sp. Alg239-R121]|uniref:hypothetical protein n=1 Tax=Pelagibius sp. Alg239-R121 TaxID=2993448 RepID=UPI0024A77C5A|nr:hypothetical protein [Pelagibius sp. Alg239-R121]
MGSFALWHWMIVLSPLALIALAVAVYKSNRLVMQREFLFWTLGLLAAVGLLAAGSTVARSIVAGPVGAIAFYLYSFFYYQRVAGRAVDAGFGKGIAFAAMIPLIGIVCLLVLLFARTKEVSAIDAPPPASDAPWRNK